jgi:DNA-binding GntR family transcriptional regulator
MPIKDELVDAIRQEIISGGLQPGQKLSESRLAERYGVSRTPVREAIKQLEIEDFVSVERRRGTFVKSLSMSDAMDLYEVREGLEGIAARLCAQRADNSLITDLDAITRQMDDLVLRDDRQAYLDADRELHALIFSGAKNRRLEDHYRMLTAHMQRDVLGGIVTAVEGRMARSLAEHTRIVRAIAVRDSAEAEGEMRTHVRTGREELAASMRVIR